MIDYLIMKPSLRNIHWIAILCLTLMAGCAVPENGSNNNAAPAAESANANAPLTAQPATPPASATPSAAAPSATAPAPPTPTPATASPAAEAPTRPAPKSEAAHAEGPKLLVVSQERELDFGKQPQDKTLVRPIRIKNAGTQPLDIQSVSPS